MHGYDTVQRILKSEYGRKSTVSVKRYKCFDCGSIKRDLPSTIEPFKQYERRIIVGVLNGSITSDLIEFEDYPCEMTMKRWKSSREKHAP